MKTIGVIDSHIEKTVAWCYNEYRDSFGLKGF